MLIPKEEETAEDISENMFEMKKLRRRRAMKRNGKKFWDRRKYLFVLAIVLLALTGCSNKAEKVKEEKEITEETKPEGETEEAIAVSDRQQEASDGLVSQEAISETQKQPPAGGNAPSSNVVESNEMLLQNKLNELLQARVSTEWVLTSEGTVEVSDFLASRQGIVNAVMADVNQDGQDEILTVICEGTDIVLKKYSISGEGIQENTLGKLFTIGYCDQISALLFYNQTLGSYCIAVNDILVGAYTGAEGFSSKLFIIQDDGIRQHRSWEWDTAIELESLEEDGYSVPVSMLDSIQNEMISLGWPYMENRWLSFRNDQAVSNVIQLMGTEIEISADEYDPPTLYVRYLRFLGCEEMPSQYF